MTENTFSSNPSLQLMSELLTCGTNISLWQYDPEGHLLETSSQHLILDKILNHISGKDYILKYSHSNSMPLIFGIFRAATFALLYSSKCRYIHESRK